MLCIKSNPQASADSEERTYVPLVKVSVNATIHSFAADVTITQIFHNQETNPIEVVYCFPIEEQAAIYSFIACIDDREIHAELNELAEAQRQYNTALQQGHGAYLLEQNEESQDNFTINIGALPPSKECTITISYVTELDFIQDSTIRFVIPTTIAPRYNPTKGGLSSPAGTQSKYVQSTPYTIDFQCRIEKLNNYINRINSPSHPIDIDFSQPDAYQIKFAQENTHLDRDILLNIELSNQRTNTIVAVEPGGIMTVFTPTKEDCIKETNQINEFIFIVDCSGSMENENKIGLARQAMILFLKSLPLKSHFNIVRFGSSYQTLFKDVTALYNEENARKAEKLIVEMDADLGGTELLQPLEWLKQHSPNKDRSRQVFLLTDGEISNVTEVIDLCRSMSLSTRIFSFGLGASPSRSLVKGLARSTNGRFVFIPPKSNVDIYVGEQLQRALQPSLTNVHVEWNLGVNVQTAPTQLPPVYANDRLIVYALIDDKTIPFDHNSSVELQTGTNRRVLGVAKINSIPNVTDNQTIARLAAKALILELQHAKTQKPSTGSLLARFKDLIISNATKSEETTIKQRIIDLSLKYSILSPHTAFIGIEKRIDASNAEMVLREVLIEISTDDQHLQSPLTTSNSSFARPSLAGTVYSNKNQKLVAACHMPRDMRKDNYCLRPMLSECISFPCARNIPWQASIQLSSSQATTPSLLDDADEIDFAARSNRVCLVENSSKSDILPTNDQDIVRYLINKQNFDGLWNLNEDIIQKLTEKSSSVLQSTNTHIDAKIFNSIIVVLLLETRFSTFSSLWYGIVLKARNRINDLLDNDSKKIDQLFNDIRNQL